MSAPGAWTQQKRGKLEKKSFFLLKMNLGVDATKPARSTFFPTPMLKASHTCFAPGGYPGWQSGLGVFMEFGLG